MIKLKLHMRVALIFLLSSLCFANILFAQQKRALIVAVGDYPDSSKLLDINSLNDIPLIESALFKLGFLKEHIFILKNEQATKRAIISNIEQHLIDESQAGDIAYFHFSGHGQQIQDYNGDEIDGYDEALVPVDAIKDFGLYNYKGEKHIADDTLGALYDRIRKKLGKEGHLLVTIDACHSGTSTRGIGSSRGVDLPMASPEYRAQSQKGKTESNQELYTEEDTKDLASLVAFFGSMASQRNFEVQAENKVMCGSLSYAFSKELNNISAGASYQQLFDRIRLTISAQPNNQTPEATGVLNQQILGGKYLGSPNYNIVKSWDNPNQVTIDAGFLSGFTIGTVVGFYPPETREIEQVKPIATGVVSSTASSASIVSLKDSFSQEQLVFSWVFIKEENFGNISVDLQLDSSVVETDTMVFKKLFQLPFLKRVNSNPDLFLYAEKDQLVLINKAEVKIDDFSKKLPPDKLLKSLVNSIKKYGQAQFLRKLNQENKRLQVNFEIILLSRNGKRVPAEYPMDSLKNSDGILELLVGDTIQLHVFNDGSNPAYYTILDFQPDEKINVVYPRPMESPSDYYLLPGKERLSRESRINPPYGNELMRLIATKNPINLSSVDQTQKRSIPGANLDPFETLFMETELNNTTSTRAGTVSNLPAGQVNIYSKQFIIKRSAK